MEPTTSAYPAYPDYPARFTFDSPERVSRWRPFVNWLLVIPHLVVLYALNVASEVLSIISWFAILFTGKNLDGIERYQTMYLRYSARAGMFWGVPARGVPAVQPSRWPSPIPATTPGCGSKSTPTSRTATVSPPSSA